MNYWITLVFLIFEAVEDLKTRRVSLVSLIAFGIFGILGNLFFWKMGIWDMCFGMATGVFLIIVSLISMGAFGIGDGAVFLVTGILLGGTCNLRVIAVSMIAAMFCGIFEVIFRNKMKEIPFIPCILFAYLEVMFFAS